MYRKLIYLHFKMRVLYPSYSVYFQLHMPNVRQSSTSTAAIYTEKRVPANFSEIPIDRIRNFSIIAHVDHGKSTLADRILELTGAIPRNSGAQFLDSLQVERERGITVKAQTASIIHTYKNQQYLLNLIDTPGHVDFSNEVSRSLAACDGVVMLVDACHGVQAQTVANYQLAKMRNLAIIPVLNKIDIKHANPDRVRKDLHSLFGIDPNTVLKVSAKMGVNITTVLDSVIEKIPPPLVDRSSPFRALIFDSWFDKYRGALNLIYILNGTLKVGQEIQSMATKKSYSVKGITILCPNESQVESISAGQVGLLACNMRNSKESIIGDTIHRKNENVIPAVSFKRQQPMVYAGVYPADQSKHLALRSAIEKLVLNDSAVTVKVDSSPALGQGWRLGFLGLLHMEVFCQRLEQEYGADPVITAPSVTYRIVFKNPKIIKQMGKDTLELSNAALFPEPFNVKEYYEPLVKGTIITPTEYMGQIISLCVDRRGIQESSINIDDERILMKYILPLSEIILDFNDHLKSISSGYASFNYEDYGYHLTNIVRLDIHLNGRPVEELCRIVHVSKASTIAREMVTKLQELIPRQMVQIAIQACVGGKVLARETIKAYRKDVTAKLYGGDVTRRMKLLKQQAEGKKKMRMFANIRVPHETFINVLKR
ncbi:PREDICTED: translation factor waclaw, mitochondrial isoform X2 [Rhagoletis zephyria]|uniref:translation factor waclaw, mitochondrial isoform X2 n=1 Tax=Rhagoletis zephyria TaxID=28612 RepID=UPI0008115763|nr:PREDICTED: translation factor waclaw, mitochondrial isoform X2 [Rhagoletis zephyria]XP_036319706.1 translation factor waclaw, mitochondrial isoform X2 [Rhagoletis pomonella]